MKSKKVKQVTLETKSSFANADRTHNEIVFDLYLRNREVSQINSSLQKILLWDLPARKTWFNDNQEVIEQLMDAFMQDSTLALDGAKLQGEALQLSVELMTNLREATTVIRSLAHGRDRLEN